MGTGDDVQSLCGGNASGDVVYGLTTNAPGLLSYQLAGDHVGDLRSTCDDEGSSLACGGFMDVCLDTAGDYALVVESGFGGDGPFGLTTAFTACDEGEVCRQGVFPDPCVTELQGGEACGDAVALPPNTTVAGTLVDATDDVETSCGGNGAPDVTYSLNVPSNGYVQSDVPFQPGTDTSASLQATCDDLDSEVFCSDAEPPQGCVRAGDYTVVLETLGRFGAEPGPYSLRATVETCTDEQTCVPFGFLTHCATALAGGDTCADAVDLPLDTLVTGDTTDATNDEQVGCAFNGGDAGDLVYHVSVPATGVLRPTFDHDFPGPNFVAIRSTCDDAGSEVACGSFDLTACVDAGEYYLVVDGDARFGVDEGLYTLSASFEACDEGEACEFGRCMPPLIPEVEPNDDGATAMTVADGQGVDATLEANNAVDYFRIDLTAGQTFIADLAGCDFDPMIFLYADPLPDPLPTGHSCNPFDPPGGAVACNDDNLGLCSHIEYTAPADGTYYLRVVSFNGGSHGNYPLVIDVL